ncbi:MAG: hypothetical protein KC416_00665 [Myxococcales bacterium]|nr:hypothetical protein [Myxococcales bacterium]
MNQWNRVGLSALGLLVVTLMASGCDITDIADTGKDMADAGTKKNCNNGLPDGTVTLQVTGAEDVDVTFVLPCGSGEGTYGAFGLNTPFMDTAVTRISFTNDDTWAGAISALTGGEIEAKTYPLIVAPEQGYGGFNIPVGASEPFYEATGGEMIIEEAVTQMEGALTFVIVSGTATMPAKLQTSGATITMEVAFDQVAIGEQ